MLQLTLELIYRNLSNFTCRSTVIRHGLSSSIERNVFLKNLESNSASAIFVTHRKRRPDNSQQSDSYPKRTRFSTNDATGEVQPATNDMTSNIFETLQADTQNPIVQSERNSHIQHLLQKYIGRSEINEANSVNLCSFPSLDQSFPNMLPPVPLRPLSTSSTRFVSFWSSHDFLLRCVQFNHFRGHWRTESSEINECHWETDFNIEQHLAFSSVHRSSWRNFNWFQSEVSIKYCIEGIKKKNCFSLSCDHRKTCWTSEWT